ncbi:MAG: aminotransferase class V-fold PLP-dependent enzyme [Halieaceae bacterium]|nr:aminotransferase class V-fold PLP-dependent enzyme [Halieaceae bacterium]
MLQRPSIPTHIGDLPITYCDYAASGRASEVIEQYIHEHILPYYANTHSDSSFCGRHTSRLREAARKTISDALGENHNHKVLFVGSGATGAVDKLVRLLDQVYDSAALEVFVGPYEHHSNDLPWRASKWNTRRIELDQSGVINLDALAIALANSTAKHRIVAVSAVSNVTGLITDLDGLVRVCRTNKAEIVLDCAAAAPYLPLNELFAGGAVSALFWSAHKFSGGPGASGVLAVKQNWLRGAVPVVKGGGTVRFVSNTRCDLVADVVRRQEGGTPNIIGDIRAALALQLKFSKGEFWLAEQYLSLARIVRSRLHKIPNLELLGPTSGSFMPTVAFNIVSGDRILPYSQVVALLSDLYGIQARGGCSCAGPYAHHLLGISANDSEVIAKKIELGDMDRSPGWVRVSFSDSMTQSEVGFVLDAIEQVALYADSIYALITTSIEGTSNLRLKEEFKSLDLFNPSPPNYTTHEIDYPQIIERGKEWLSEVAGLGIAIA